MPATVINPHDGDDLSAASITTNVTDKMVAWEGSHETGATTNGAVRHASDQIDDIALPESAVPSSTAQTSGAGVHARLDMFAVVLSAMMGTSGTGYAAKYTQLGSLTYGTLNAINTALSSGASAAAGAATLVRRAADGSANFSGTVGVVALSGTGNWATTGSVTAAGATFSGVIVAGSGARQITTLDGHLDAAQLTGVLAAAAMPALTGDVVGTVGTVATTVSLVGGKSAAQVGSAVTSVLAASSSGVGNHGAIAKYDVSGGMTFDAAVTAPTFVGSATTVVDSAITASKIANYAVTRLHLSEGSTVAQATPNKTVQVAPYYYYNSANIYGTPPGVSPAIDAINPLPSAGQQRYDLLYTDDAFGLDWLAGVPASSNPAKPTLPVGSTAKPLAWAGPITNATAALTTAMLFDARPSPASGGSSGGGGGGGGAPASSPYVTIGNDPTLTAETDLFAISAGTMTGIVNGKDFTTYFTGSGTVKGAAATDAGLADAWQAGISSNVIGSLSASGGRIVVGVNQGPIFLTLNNRPRRIASALTASNDLTGSGGGIYKVVLDLTGVGPSPTLFTTQSTIQVNQYWIANVYWTGSVFDFTYIDWQPAFPQYLPPLIIQQPLVAPQVSITNTAMANVSGVPTKVVNLPCSFSWATVTGMCWVQQPATPGTLNFVEVALDGTSIGSNEIVDGVPASKIGTVPLTTVGGPVTPGAHTFSVEANVQSAASPFTFYAVQYGVRLDR